MKKKMLSLLLALSGCFDASVADSPLFRCSADAPLCPSGKTCISGCCLYPDVTIPLTCQTDDAGVVPPIDAASSSVDMSPLGLPKNCAYLPGSTAFLGCAGKWSTASEAKNLCPAGYVLCDKTRSFPTSLWSACSTFTGTTGIGSSLFLADITVSLRSDGSLSTCGYVQAGESAATIACGQTSQKFNIGCNGFQWGAVSSKLGPIGISGSGGATLVVNSSPNNGVLCCR